MTKTGSTPAASPDDLLKAVVSGVAQAKQAPAPAEASTAGPAVPMPPRRDLRLIGAAGAALALGALLGAGATTLAGSVRGRSDAVAAVEAGRAEIARLGGDIAQLHQILADLRAGADAGRKDGTARHAALSERLAQTDRAFAARMAALGDRLDQAEREQGARLSALAVQLDRRPAVGTPPAKAEPTQTGSLPDARGAEIKPVQDSKTAEIKTSEARQADARTADAKPVDAKPRSVPDRSPVIDGWAVRDIYDGAAILENRRRRLVEVAPGDVVPGVGRVEGVERRGRDWVVVTRQGLITPQPW